MRKIALVVFLFCCNVSFSQSKITTLKGYYGEDGFQSLSASDDTYWLSFQSQVVSVDRKTGKETHYDNLTTNGVLIPSSYYSIESDKKNNVLVHGSTTGDLYKFDNGKWEKVTSPSRYTKIIKKDVNDNLWLLTDSSHISKIYKYNGGVFTQKFADIPHSCYDFEISPDGHAYIAVDSNLLTWERGFWVKPANYVYATKRAIIQRLKCTPDSILYTVYKKFGALNRVVSYYDGQTTVFDTLSQQFNILSSVTNHGDTILLAGHNTGFLKYFKGSETYYNQAANNLISNSVSTVVPIAPDTLLYGIQNTTDHCGSWGFMTPNGATPVNLLHYDLPGGETGTRTYCIGATKKNGRLFVGLEDKILEFKNNRWETMPNVPPTTVVDSYFRNFATDDNDDVWAATSSGVDLYKYDGDQWLRFSTPSFNGGQSLNGFFIDYLGQVWMSVSNNGLWKFDGSNWTLFHNPDTTTAYDYHEIAGDLSGNIYIATNKNIYKFDGNSWISMGLPPSYYRIVPDEHYGFWAWDYTLDILYHFDGLNLTGYNSLNSPLGSLHNESISNIYIDPQDRTWFFMEFQLVCIDKQGTHIYFQGEKFSSGRGFGDAYGNMWISTVRNLYAFNATGINFNTINLAPSLNIVSGSCFYDFNSNGIKDSVDYIAANTKIIYQPDSSARFLQSGNYGLGLDSGNYKITFPADSMWGIIPGTPDTYNITVDSTDISNLDFALYPKFITENARITVTNDIIRCSSTFNVWVTLTNTGVIPISGGLYLYKDPSFTLVSSSVTPTVIMNDSLGWSYNLIPGKTITIMLQFTTSASMGTQVFFIPSATFNGHGNVTLDDPATAHDIVRCSLDPNDKQVIPQGETTQHFTLKANPLYYTVRFQNTGNDTAFVVSIVDTLSPFLDFSTFEVLSSSHPVNTTLKPDGTVIFRFDNILLPDSFVNEPGSHGYVLYRIKPKANITDYDVIENFADIYFDFNQAVRTNSTSNTMVTSMPVGLSSPEKQSSVTIYPNPTTGDVTISWPIAGSATEMNVTVSNLQGQTVLKKSFSDPQNAHLHLNDLPSGIYFIDLHAGKYHEKCKIVRVD